MSKAKKKPQTVTPKQGQYLRGLGHHLSPLAMVGHGGIDDQLVTAVEDVLTAHELIKIKLQSNCPLDRKEVAAVLSTKTRAATIQILGKTILLYRENKDKKGDKKITLP